MQFRYTCKHCQDTYWITSAEAKTDGFKIVCFCGKVIVVKKLSKIKVTYNTGDPTKDTKEILVPSVTEAYDKLTGLGYKHKEMNARLVKLGPDTVENLIKKYIREYE